MYSITLFIKASIYLLPSQLTLSPVTFIVCIFKFNFLIGLGDPEIKK